MHDWQSEVRARPAPLRLRPEREADIVDEISQHLAERYREATQAGHRAVANCDGCTWIVRRLR